MGGPYYTDLKSRLFCIYINKLVEHARPQSCHIVIPCSVVLPVRENRCSGNMRRALVANGTNIPNIEIYAAIIIAVKMSDHQTLYLVGGCGLRSTQVCCDALL